MTDRIGPRDTRASRHNLASGFHAQARQRPEEVALVVGGNTWTYGSLGELAAASAGWIAERAGVSNPRVGVLASRSIEAYVGVLAAAWAGAAYVPLSPSFPARRIGEIIADAGIRALIVDQEGLAAMGRGLPLPPDLPVLRPSAGAHPPLENPARVSPEDMAYLMFTSGTTGRPKGIPVTVGNVRHLVAVLQERYAIASTDRLSQFFELTFDLSVFDIFMALGFGAELHVVPPTSLMTPAGFIRDHRLTVWFSVPSLAGALERMRLLKPGAFPSLRLSLFCGEALPAASAVAWQKAAPGSLVDNLYGPTEATVVFMAQRWGEPGAITPGRGIVAIGHPLPGLHAAIVDPDRRFLPPGEPGELALSGPQVTPGYWCDEALSARSFPTLEHPVLGSTRWYLTGDRACQDLSGLFHFMGRVDNQVKIHGWRIELEEVEHHLREISGVANVAAVVIEGKEDWDRELVGVVEAGEIDPAALQQGLDTRLPAYMIPRRIVPVKWIPRNASGKLDRRELIRRIGGAQE